MTPEEFCETWADGFDPSMMHESLDALLAAARLEGALAGARAMQVEAVKICLHADDCSQPWNEIDALDPAAVARQALESK